MIVRAEAGRSSQSLVLTGLRGVGKTVLLNELAERARRRDWIVAQVEAPVDTVAAGSSFRAMVARSLYQSLRYVTGSWGVGERLRAALATFKSFSVRTDPSGGLSLGIDIDAQRGRVYTGSLEMDLSEVAFDLGASASDRGTGVAVFVDEMQELSQIELAAICTAVHEAGVRDQSPSTLSVPDCRAFRGSWLKPGLIPIRARLIHEGVVYAPEHGLVAYTAPGMAEFINPQVD